MEVTITVNGTPQTVDVEPRTLLVHVIREQLELTGTHVGCDTTSCGACTVLLDGEPVNSCMVLAHEADGHDVVTIEGLADGAVLHPVQRAFVETECRSESHQEVLDREIVVFHRGAVPVGLAEGPREVARRRYLCVAVNMGLAVET